MKKKLLLGLVVLGLVFSFIGKGIAEEKGLVLYLSFDEGKGNIVRDKSGTGYRAKVHGASWARGISDGCLSFNGGDEYISAPDIPSPHTLDYVYLPSAPQLMLKTFTVSLWIKTGRDNKQGYLLRVNADNPSIPNYNLSLRENQLFVATATQAKKWIYARGGPVVNDNIWHHVAGTYDGETLKLYLDGVKLTERYIGEEVVTGNAGGGIGDNAWKSGQTKSCFKGLIDEVRIYNRALSAEEIIVMTETFVTKPLLVKVEKKKTGKMLPDPMLIRDLSRFGNNGKISGGKWVGGKFGKALKFGDDGGCIFTSNKGWSTIKGTIEMWVCNPGSAENAYRYFTSYANPTNGFWLYSTDFSFHHSKSGEQGPDFIKIPPEALSPNIWHHILLTWGEGRNLYIDGKLIGKSVKKLKFNYFNTNPLIGSGAKGAAIDNVRIYSRVLTLEEIAARYRNKEIDRDGIALDLVIEEPKVISIALENGSPGNIFFLEEEVKMDIEIKNPFSEKKKLNLSYSVKDYYGKEIKKEERIVKIKPETAETYNLELLPDRHSKRGFFTIDYTIFEEGKPVAAKEGSFGVVPSAFPVRDKDRAFFGLHRGRKISAAAMRRIGVEWTGTHVCWRVVEPQENSFVWGALDKKIKELKNYNFHIINLTCYPADTDMGWNTSAPAGESRRTYPPIPEKTANYVYHLVSRYKGQVEQFAFFGEPNGHCFQDNIGYWAAPENVKKNFFTFIDILKKSCQAAKKANPDIEIYGCFVNGCDCRLMERSYNTVLMKALYPERKEIPKYFAFSRELFKYASDSFDFFAIDPYPSVRQFGHPTRIAKQPESQFEMYEQAKELIAQYGNKHRLVISELGWLVDKAGLYSLNTPYTKELAGCMVRAHVMALANNVKQLIWTIGRFVRYTEGGDSGLWAAGLNEPQPYPNAIAYANMAYLLRGIENPERLNLPSGVYGYIFKKGRGSIVILWSPAKETVITFTLGKSKIQVLDIMGNRIDSEKRGKIKLVLTDKPLYIIGERVDAKSLSKAIESGNIPIR